MAGGRRRRVEHTEDWEQLGLLVRWPEQGRYEEIRPLVLFGDPVPSRAEETGTSERTLYRRVESFERNGVESLFATERAKRGLLPPWIRNLIVGLKAEYPPFNLNEIANIVYVHSGRKPDVRTVRGVLEESALPLKVVRLFEPYHEIEEGRERRIALVSLHSSGWRERSLTLEYAGEALARYDVVRDRGATDLKDVSRPRLFETSHAPAQPRLVRLEALGEGGWLKAMRLAGYAPRTTRRPEGLQQALFSHHEAWG